MFKQKRLTIDESLRGLAIFNSIPIQYIKTDFVHAIKISKEADIYAYTESLLKVFSHFVSRRDHRGFKNSVFSVYSL